jgi:MinD superfamily P-loop ATPase
MLEINHSDCIDCLQCMDVCKHDAIHHVSDNYLYDIDPEFCQNCGDCVKICSNGAITNGNK